MALAVAILVVYMMVGTLKAFVMGVVGGILMFSFVVGGGGVSCSSGS